MSNGSSDNGYLYPLNSEEFNGNASNICYKISI